MSTARRIARNTGYLFTGEVVGRILSTVLILALARVLGDAQFGLYSFAFAFASLFLIFSDMGLSTLLIKEVAKDRLKASRYLSNIFSLKLVLLLVFGVAMLLLITFTAQDALTVQAVAIVILAMLFNFLTEPFRSIFLSFERHEYYSAVLVVERALTAAFGLAVLLLTHSLLAVLWVYVAAYAITFALALLLVVRRFHVTFTAFHVDVLAWSALLRSSWPYWFSLLFMAIYYRIDTLMLSAMTNFAVVGWYNAAYRMVEALSFIPLIVISAVFPAMSRFHVESRTLLAKLYGKVFYYMLVLGIPLAVGTTILAAQIIATLYTPEFSRATIVLQFLIWSEALIFLNYIIGYLLNSIDRQRQFTIATAALLLVNVVLNYVAIPRFAHAGAAAVTVLTQIVGVGILYYFAAKSGYSVPLPKLIVKPAIASGVMAALLLVGTGTSIFILIPAGAVTYVITLLLIKGIGSEEIGLVKSLLRFRQPER